MQEGWSQQMAKEHEQKNVDLFWETFPDAKKLPTIEEIIG